MTRQTEREFKLRADNPLTTAAIDAALRESELTVRHSETQLHHDTYFDDHLQSLRTAGVGLRLRQNRHGQRLTCKLRASNKRRDPALFERSEREAAWAADAPPQAAHELHDDIRHVVEPFCLTRTLMPGLRLEVTRDLRVLANSERDACELAIDSVTANFHGRSARFQEIELEALDDLHSTTDLATQLRDQLDLTNAPQDKPSYAASLLGAEQPRTKDDMSTTSQPLADGVAQRLDRQLRAMRRAEQAVREQRDPKHIRKMRKATQRIRALVFAFRQLWPDDVANRLLAGIGETDRRLNNLCELDAMLATSPDHTEELPATLRAAGIRGIEWARGQRELAHDQLQAWLQEPARLEHCAALSDELTAIDPHTPVAQQPIAAAARQALHEAVRELRDQIATTDEELPTDAAHRLRAATDHVHDLTDQFDKLPGHGAKKARRAVARARRALAAVCDHEAASERLLGWVHQAASASNDGAWTAAAFGGMASNHGLAALGLRLLAALELESLDRKKHWRRLAPSPD